MITDELIVVRHGESTWNLERRWAGQADPPLTALGRRQAAILAERCRNPRFGTATDTSRRRTTNNNAASNTRQHPITDNNAAIDTDQRRITPNGAGIAAVVTSDLSRARETGLIVAAALGLPAPAEISDLRERWSTTLTGRTDDEIEQVFPGALSAWRDGLSKDLPGDSEPFDAFATRIVRGLLAAPVTGQTVLVVAHAGVIRALGMMTRNGAEPRIGHAAGRRIVVGPDGVTDKGPAFA